MLQFFQSPREDLLFPVYLCVSTVEHNVLQGQDWVWIWAELSALPVQSLWPQQVFKNWFNNFIMIII